LVSKELKVCPMGWKIRPALLGKIALLKVQAGVEKNNIIFFLVA